MLYLEDEDNVRPSWMPYKNDYRCLNISELVTIEDCDEATLWLHDRITDMHAWIAAANDPEHTRRFRRHISRAHFMRKRIELLRDDYWREENSTKDADRKWRNALRAIIIEQHGKEEYQRLVELTHLALDTSKEARDEQ